LKSFKKREPSVTSPKCHGSTTCRNCYLMVMSGSNSEQVRLISQKNVLKSGQKSTVLLFKILGAAKPKNRAFSAMCLNKHCAADWAVASRV
jgi:hypothetical protein